MDEVEIKAVSAQLKTNQQPKDLDSSDVLGGTLMFDGSIMKGAPNNQLKFN